MRTRKTVSRESRRSLPARLKSGARRAQLLRIAKRLFSERGFESTTTKAIAAEAGVSEAIIFRHFRSKEALYESILDQKAGEIGLKTWGDELKAYSASENDEAMILSVVQHILEADRRDPQFRKLMLRSALSGHPSHKITAQRLSPLHRLLIRYAKKRQQRGAFQNCDPELIAHAIIGIPSYCGLAQILYGLDDLNLSEKEMASSITRLILEGIRAPGGAMRKKRGAPSKTGK